MASYVQAFDSASVSIRMEYFDTAQGKTRQKVKTFSNVKNFTVEEDVDKVGEIGWGLAPLVNSDYTVNAVFYNRKLELQA